MGATVFISHSHKDGRYVKRLYAHLRRHNIDAWYDAAVQNRRRFSEELQKKIDECTVLVVVESPDSFASEWVQDEFLRARLAAFMASERVNPARG